MVHGKTPDKLSGALEWRPLRIHSTGLNACNSRMRSTRMGPCFSGRKPPAKHWFRGTRLSRSLSRRANDCFPATGFYSLKYWQTLVALGNLPAWEGTELGRKRNCWSPPAISLHTPLRPLISQRNGAGSELSPHGHWLSCFTLHWQACRAALYSIMPHYVSGAALRLARFATRWPCSPLYAFAPHIHKLGLRCKLALYNVLQKCITPDT